MQLLSFLSQRAVLFQLRPSLFVVQVDNSQLCRQILTTTGTGQENSLGYRLVQYDIFEDLQGVLHHVVLRYVPARVSSDEIIEHLSSHVEGVLGIKLLVKSYQPNLSATCRTQTFAVSMTSHRAAQRLLKEGRYRFVRGISFEVQPFVRLSNLQGPRFARSQDRHGTASPEDSHGKQMVSVSPSFLKKEEQPKSKHPTDSSQAPVSRSRADQSKYHRIDINAKVHLAKPSSAKYFQSRSNLAAYASQGLCHRIIFKAPGSSLPPSSHIKAELSAAQSQSIQSDPL